MRTKEHNNVWTHYNKLSEVKANDKKYPPKADPPLAGKERSRHPRCYAGAGSDFMVFVPPLHLLDGTRLGRWLNLKTLD